MSRETWVGRTVTAGCYDCNDMEPMWYGKNAQGVAARHHDAHGHVTWVEVNMSISYGGQGAPLDKRGEGGERARTRQGG